MSKAAHTHPTAPLCIADLLPELTAGIAGHIAAGAVLPFACTSKQCLAAAKTAHDAKGLRAHPRWMCASSISLVEWALKEPKVVTFGNNLLHRAAESGNLPVLIWLNDYDDENRLAGMLNATLCAAEYGRTDALQWLRNRGCRWEKSRCEDAASRGGHHETAEWIRTQPED